MVFFANISKMHNAGKKSILVYIYPTHEKLKTHFGFSLAQFIKKLQAKDAKKGHLQNHNHNAFCIKKHKIVIFATHIPCWTK